MVDIGPSPPTDAVAPVRISGIPSARIHEFWELTEPLIASACETARGKWNASYIRKQLEYGAMQLWLVTDGTVLAVCVTEIVRHPGKRCCRIRIMTGQQRERWQHFLGVIEAWAKAQGCDAMELIARSGWSRILGRQGYAVTHLFCEKEIF